MKYLSLLILYVAATELSAQTFSDLNDKKDRNLYDNYSVQAFLRYTNFSDPYVETVSGTTVNMSVRGVSGYGKGDVSVNFENPTLGDLIYALLNYKKLSSSTVNKSFGSGFLGWIQVYFNAVVLKRLIIAPGFSVGDYIFGIQQPKLQEPNILEPNGYYFHLGPAVKASYVVSNNLWLEGYVHNDIGFRAGNPGGVYQNIDGYKKPYFFNVGATAYHTSRFFGGFRMCKLIDRGVNDIKATRLDISAGYMFK